MVVTCNSFGVSGMDGYKVELEASMYNGTREFDMVGLPDAAVRESKDRVLSALKNCGFRYPAAHMTVNLAPADIKKEGPIYDLPIAVAILILLNQIKSNISDCAFIGELSLSGEVSYMVLDVSICSSDLSISCLNYNLLNELKLFDLTY